MNNFLKYSPELNSVLEQITYLKQMNGHFETFATLEAVFSFLDWIQNHRDIISM